MSGGSSREVSADDGGEAADQQRWSELRDRGVEGSQVFVRPSQGPGREGERLSSGTDLSAIEGGLCCCK